ncbi:hypothetical protein KEM48_009302 [Puccinia striiformis f. sp. tritici PST-130]|nr:hypothetical protein KEM48_009302 [Puccinia striiformis f. sp. tritici PST-130]
MIADHLNNVGPLLANSFNDRKSPSLESEQSSSIGDVYWSSSTVSSNGPGYLTLKIDPRLFGLFNNYTPLPASSDRLSDPADIDQLDNIAYNQEPVLSAPVNHIFSWNKASVEMSSSVANDRLDGTSIASNGKRFRLARQQPSVRSSGLNRVKPTPVCHCMRDARGRFISSQTKKPAEIPKKRSWSPLGPAQSPPACLTLMPLVGLRWRPLLTHS